MITTFTQIRRASVTLCLILAVGLVSAQFCEAASSKTSQNKKTSEAKTKSKKRSRLAKSCSGGITGLSGGILWKPAADAADVRRGKPVVLFTGGSKPGTSSIKVFTAKGQLLCTFPYKASATPYVNNGAHHYFSGWRGGCGKTGSQLSSEARRLSGSSVVYFQGARNRCHGPVSPTGRAGNI